MRKCSNNKSELIRSGRIKVYLPNHPRSDSDGYVYRSIIVSEKVLGKQISNGIVVHHIDKNKLNDSNNNLIICEDIKYHNLLHARERAYINCGNANYRKCYICQKYDDPKNLCIYRTGAPHHRKCKREKALIEYKKNIENGKCTVCKKPVVPGKTKCKKHLSMSNKKSLEYYYKGKCKN